MSNFVDLSISTVTISSAEYLHNEYVPGRSNNRISVLLKIKELCLTSTVAPE